MSNVDTNICRPTYHWNILGILERLGFIDYEETLQQSYEIWANWVVWLSLVLKPKPWEVEQVFSNCLDNKRTLREGPPRPSPFIPTYSIYFNMELNFTLWRLLV